MTNFLKKIYHIILAYAAYFYYGRPSRKLIVIGVTGTKGKSSTCRFIASVLEAGGYKVGLASTVEFQVGDKRWLNTKKMTMLGRGQLQKLLRDMVHAGCRYAVVETSSEGILQNRHIGLNYDVAVFTNLGTEHQERHGGFVNLRRDKGKLFASLSKHRHKVIDQKNIKTVSIVNADDKEAEFFLSFSADEKIIYTLGHSNKFPSYFNVVGQIISSDSNGTTFIASGKDFRINIPGNFNVYNALSALAVGYSQNIPLDKMYNGINSVKYIPGRMEFINEGQPFGVVVDYAHEPLSYTALFETLRRQVGPDHKIISVIGSDGGGRDVGKRSQMGAIAGKLTDIVIVTDVNCADEDPKVIAEMLAEGARATGKKDDVNLFVETDRKKGISLALFKASAGDVVAITAKGSETVMIIGNNQTIPWSDTEITKELLQTYKNVV